MGFKLVRVDAPEPAKIPLNSGTQIIGRGSFPDCEDNRMSRKHALVVVTGDTVTLKSLHQNPCFYSISDAGQTLMLPQGETVSLKNGDHFGLLPDKNWYELIYHKESELTTNPSSMVEENRVSLCESFLGTFSTQYGNKQVSDVKEKTNNSRANFKSTNLYKRKNYDGDNDSDSSTLSLERDGESTQITEPQPSTSRFNAQDQVPNDANTTQNELGQTGADETYSDVRTPTKRSRIPDSISDAKKVKTEPESPETNSSHDTTEKPESTENTTAQVHDPDTTIEPQLSMDTEPEDANTESQDPINVNAEPENPNNANTEHPNDANDSQSLSAADDENKEPQVPTDVNTEPKNIKIEPQSSMDINTEPQNPTNTDSLGPNDANTEAQKPTDGDTEANSSNGNEVKTELQSPKDEKDVKEDPDAAVAGPSQAQPGSSKDGEASNVDAPPKPPVVPDRERCMYGVNCYRLVDTAQCPYGSQCLRRDARHWTTHEHPPGAAPPAPHPDPTNRQGIRVVQRRGQIFYINAHSVHFHDDYYELENQDGDRVDYDYEF